MPDVLDVFIDHIEEVVAAKADVRRELGISEPKLIARSG